MIALQPFLSLIYIVGLSGVLIGCSSAKQPQDRLHMQQHTAHSARELKRYETADPNADLQAAIKKGDLRFLAIKGYTLTVPGVEDYKSKYANKYSYRILEGTSDVVNGPEDLRFQSIAQRYAEKYNRLLLKHILSPSA
jgi:hypothetical protein